MVEKTAAFRQRRAADTARWRERLHRGAAVNPVEVDGTTFDLMERFGGLKAMGRVIGTNADMCLTCHASIPSARVIVSVRPGTRPAGALAWRFTPLPPRGCRDRCARSP